MCSCESHKFSRSAWQTVLLFSAATMSAWAASPEQQKSWEDRDLFPEAYGILTSDRVMFPDNCANWPLKIDATHQLFIDDHVMSAIEGLTREYHQPVKHPKNPLMRGGYANVLYDQERGLFRLWNGGRYFTSKDGVVWEQAGTVPAGYVMYNPDIPEEEGRYKGITEQRYNPDKNEPGGFYLYHSRDGLTWEQRPQRPVLQRSINCMFPGEFHPQAAADQSKFQWTNPDHIQLKGVGDTTRFRYDTVLKRYICDGKVDLYLPEAKIKELGIGSDGKPRLRLRTFAESEDLIHWSPPRMTIYPDRLDPNDRQIYCHMGFVYESMWVGILQAMRYHTTGWKQTELQLTYSRDGRHWLRPQHREPFIPLGDSDSWEADYSLSSFTAPVLVGDELFIYYGGSRNPARDKRPESDWPIDLGLSKLRRDGFASLNAGDNPGQIVTRPLTFTGRKLFVNAEIADGGWVKAAALSHDSKPVDGCTLEDAVALTKGTTGSPMIWKAKDQLQPPGDDHLRILLQIKNAKLYSFWIE